MKNIIVLLTSTLALLTLAQGQSNSASLTIRSEYLSEYDTLELYVWRDLIGGEYQAPHDIIHLPINEEGLCQTVITDVKQYMLVSLNLSYQKKKGTPTNGIFRLLQIEMGDDITVQLIPQMGKYRPLGGGYDNGEPVFLQNWKPIFTGGGSERMALQYEIAQTFTAMMNQIGAVPDSIEWVVECWHRIDSIENSGIELLEERLSSSATKEQLKVEIESWSLYTKTKILEKYRTMTMAKGLSLNKVSFSNLTKMLIQKIRQLPEQAMEKLAYSPRMLEACTIIAEFWSMDRSPNFNLTDVTGVINENFVGKLLKERITAALLIRRFPQYPDTALLASVVSNTTNEYALLRLSTLDIFGKGALFPDFSLPDVDNNHHRLSDYRGKVVLVDFWYMACIPCRIFMESEMGPLAELYRDSKEVQIIAISLDDRNTLSRAIKDGVIPDGLVSLFTDNKKFKHPYIERLAIRAYPFPILLDKKGRVILTGNRLKKGNTLIRLIEEYRNEIAEI